MRKVIVWYFVFLALIVVLCVAFVNFSAMSQVVRLALALVALVINPFLILESTAKADSELQDNNLRLETQADKLRQEVNHLKETDKSKSEFVSMAAHQLRTPLSAIKWTFHMIMKGELGPVTADQRSFLQKGYDSSDKVISVVNDWLNLDYLEANKNKYDFAPTDIRKLVDGVIFEFHERVQEKNIDLTVEHAKTDIPKVEVDPIKFSMVIENLIDNAIKYTPPKGKITVAVREETKNKEKEIELIVSDTGIGIPEKEQEKLFRQFFRSSNAAAASPRGSGLGLFIIKNLVEGHHGTVRLESEEGKGTKFMVTVPLKQKIV